MKSWPSNSVLVLLVAVLCVSGWTLQQQRERAARASADLYSLNAKLARYRAQDDATIMPLWLRPVSNRLRHENALAQLAASLQVLRDSQALAPTPRQVAAATELVQRMSPVCAEIDRTDAELERRASAFEEQVLAPQQRGVMHRRQQLVRRKQRQLFGMLKRSDEVCDGLCQVGEGKELSY